MPFDGTVRQWFLSEDRGEWVRHWEAVVGALLVHVAIILLIFLQWWWQSTHLVRPLEPVPVRLVQEQPPPPAPPPAPKPAEAKPEQIPEPALPKFATSGKDEKTQAPTPAEKAAAAAAPPPDTGQAPDDATPDDPAAAAASAKEISPLRLAAGKTKPQAAVARPDTRPKAETQTALRVAPARPPEIEAGDKEMFGNPYLNRIRDQVGQQEYYPTGAGPLGLEGTAVFGIAIDQSGNLVQAILLQSSGVSILDDAGITAIRRAAPFPPPPQTRQGVLQIVARIPIYSGLPNR